MIWLKPPWPLDLLSVLSNVHYGATRNHRWLLDLLSVSLQAIPASSHVRLTGAAVALSRDEWDPSLLGFLHGHLSIRSSSSTSFGCHVCPVRSASSQWTLHKISLLKWTFSSDKNWLQNNPKATKEIFRHSLDVQEPLRCYYCYLSQNTKYCSCFSAVVFSFQVHFRWVWLNTFVCDRIKKNLNVFVE